MVFSACCALQTLAQTDGGKAGAFLRYGVGGRAMGMGRAFVAVSEDASSVGLNPAGLVGAKRMEITSMYTNLFFDSRFTQLGLVYPRPYESVKNPMLRFLFGPNAAFGFNWIGLSMTGFEQRSSTGHLLGEFGVSENAFLFGWAREETGDWGLVRYGLTFKGVNQNYPGLEASADLDGGWSGRDWSWGMDAGFSFQPIHAPLFRVFSLKYLVPLRIGFAVQNAVQPGWKTSAAKDRFPRVYRGGLSYRMVLRDWIPSSWSAFRQFVGNSHVLAAVDWEWMRGTSTGHYFGMEGIVPLFENRLQVHPRFGLNSRTDGPSLGIGIVLPFTQKAQIQLDYAYGFHPYLPNDNRFFMTIKLGNDRGIGFFQKQSEKTRDQVKTEREWLLKTVAEYPSVEAHLAARRMAMLEEDSLHIRRFYDLIGGIELANALFQDAKLLMRQTKADDAKKKSLDAIKEYTSLFNQRENNPLGDNDLMNYGESLLMAGRPQDAIRVLQEILVPTIRSHFLSGVGERTLGNWDGAIASFKNSVNAAAENARENMSESALNPESMVGISYLGIGESLMRKNEFRDAMGWFDRAIQDFPDSLDWNYPRHPVFPDQNLVDEAQFLKGLCCIQSRDYENGISTLLETERFYPFFDYGIRVGKMAGTLVEVLERKDWPTLLQIADDLYKGYNQIH